jgi:hypothetical protein
MARYANNGIFNVKYPTRRKIQVILQKLISQAGAIDTGALYDSVRINANIPALGELEIQIIAMYYFGFLNNGTIYIDPYDFCAELTNRLNSEGITTEIYTQYTEWMTERYPILEVAQILGEKRSIIYTFEPIGGEFSAPLSFRGML